jgi:hypothetical protein
MERRGEGLSEPWSVISRGNTMARRRRSTTLASQALELGIAVPQVIAHRMARMALASASPSARDRAEFELMGAEKIAAASEAWTAMAAQAVVENQKLALRLMQSLWLPGIHPGMTPHAISTQMSQAAIGILGKGMAPIRRRAVANAKRLGNLR